MIQAIKEEAYHVGFSDDEIQTVGISRKKEKVFCVKCYSYNSKKKKITHPANIAILHSISPITFLKDIMLTLDILTLDDFNKPSVESH